MARHWLVAVRAEPGLGLWREAKRPLAKLWFSLQGPCRDSAKIWPGGGGRQVTLLGVLLHRKELYLIEVCRDRMYGCIHFGCCVWNHAAMSFWVTKQGCPKPQCWGIQGSDFLSQLDPLVP